MLSELHIENIAVIERADLRFTAGFNVLTGETGAGKSIVIDAIGAVLGERVNRDLVRRGAEKGLVTAVFDLQGVEPWLEENDIEAEDELILQRRIGADGKNSARVCGVPVTAAQMKELASLLVDIHGQNDGRQLMDERLHRGYLDRFGDYPEAIERFSAAYRDCQSVKKEIERLQMDEIEKARLIDSLQYQIKELEDAELREGEEEELNARRDLLRNAEKLTELLDESYTALYDGDGSALTQAQNASYFADKAASLTPELEQAAKSIRDASFLLTDAAETLRDFRESLDFSPEEYDRMETRLALFRRLERKYGREVDELPAYLDEIRARLDEIRCADDRLDKLQRELDAQTARCREAGFALRRARRSAADVLEQRIMTEAEL